MSALERWAPIPGYEGRYDASDAGRIRSWARGGNGRILTSTRQKNGRYTVSLYGGGRRVTAYVAPLVLRTFVGPCPVGQQARHVVTNDTSVNALWNLAYGSPAENAADKVRHGTHLAGERHPRSVLSDADVAAVIADPRRQADIAAEYRISQAHVSCLKRGSRRTASVSA